MVARTEFDSADGMRGFSVEYPVKWADGNEDDTFRVETGPVVLLDPERVQVGQSPEFDDFQWAYLDYRSFEQTKVFLERPTPVLPGTLWQHHLPRKPSLSPEQRETIERHVYSGWKSPIPIEDLKSMYMRNHYSTAERSDAKTQLFCLD